MLQIKFIKKAQHIGLVWVGLLTMLIGVLAVGLFITPSVTVAQISPIGIYDRCEGTCGCQPKTQSPVVSETSVTNECGQGSGASINGNTVTAFAWNESATLSDDGTILAWEDGSNWIRSFPTPTPTPTPSPTPTAIPSPTTTPTPTGSSCLDKTEGPNECAKCCVDAHDKRRALCGWNVRCLMDSVEKLQNCAYLCTRQ